MSPLPQTTKPGAGHHANVQRKPSWVEQSSIPCRYYSDGASGDADFWYQTEEDLRNGLTYTDDINSQPSEDFFSKSHSLPPYGGLRMTVADGNAWCSLHDAGRMAGVPTTNITGCPTFSSVRGHPGYLKPDGIRNLCYQGIPDEGIRLEAIIPALVNARDGQRLSKWLLDKVIPDVYADFPKMADAAGTLVMDALRSFDRSGSQEAPTRRNEIIFYNETIGEFRAVRMGASFWFRLGDITNYLSVPPGAITLALGNERVITTAETSDRARNHHGTVPPQYLEFSACGRVLELLDPEEIFVNTLAPKISKFLMDLRSQSLASADG